MRLKKKYYRLLDDLANYSQEVVLESSFFGSGVSNDSFVKFLRAYYALLCAFPDSPRKLLKKK